MRARLAVAAALVLILTGILAPGTASAGTTGTGRDRAPVGGEGDQASDGRRSASFDELAAAAGPRGTVRAMVELAVPVLPEGDLAERAVDRQRAAIAAVASSVVRRLGSEGVRMVRRYESIPFLSVEASRSAIERMRGLPEVVTAAEVVTGTTLGVGAPEAVLAPEAWDLGTDGAGQMVVVIDTGMDSSLTSEHPDLAAKVVQEACFVAGGTCPNSSTSDEGPGAAMHCGVAYCYHGTAVASIVAATAPGASLFPINVARAGIFSEIIEWDDLALALDHVTTTEAVMPIAAINVSLGHYGPYTNCDNDPSFAAIKAAVENLASMEIPTVVAAGNDGTSTSLNSPACLSEVITVAATGSDHQEYAGYSDSTDGVDLWAPGGFEPDEEPPPGDCDYWWGLEVLIPYAEPDRCNLSGTSFAAPHVAGAYAIVRQALEEVDAPGEDLLEIGTAALIDHGEPYTDPRNDVTRPKLKIAPAVEAIMPPGARGAFHVSAPDRIVDTALGVGTCDGFPCTTLPGTGVPVSVQVAGEGAVPADTVSAAVLRLSITDSTGSGLVVVNPTDLDLPADGLLITPGGPSSTTMVAAVDSEGAVSLAAGFADIDVQIDVLGWYDTAEGDGVDGFTAVEPARVLDTADSGGICSPSPCARLTANVPVEVEVAGQGGVPSSDVSAVVVNVAASDAASAGVVSVAADSFTAPSSILDVDDGRDAAEVAVIPVSSSGTITLSADVAADVVFEVTGWYGEQDGGRLRTRGRVFALDPGGDHGTCLPGPCGPVDETGDVRVKVAGVGGVPAHASAVALHVVAGSTSGPSVVEVNPDDGAGTSAGRLVVADEAPESASTMVIAQPDTEGYVTLRASTSTEVNVFVTGSFGPPL